MKFTLSEGAQDCVGF